MIKNLSVFLMSFILTALFVVISPNFSQPEKVVQKSGSSKVVKKIIQNRPNQVFAQEIKKEYFPPVSINIPKINLSAEVVSVGIDSLGRMDVPNNFVQTGWYNLGYKAGENGSVVVDGHHDDFSGNPAVFFNLSMLEPGDEINLTDEKGKQFTYVVTEKNNFPYDQLPMQFIFASNDKARLNLITCAGVYDSGRGDYSDRTVIYSELRI